MYSGVPPVVPVKLALLHVPAFSTKMMADDELVPTT
jgi:hypothetical protein